MPIDILRKIVETLPSNRDRVHLRACSRAMRDGVDHTWGPSSYEGLIPHRRPKKTPEDWLQLCRERPALKTSADNMLASCNGYLKRRKPDRFLASLAPETPDRFRLWHGARVALKMQGRDEDLSIVDHHEGLNAKFFRALTHKDAEEILALLRKGAQFDCESVRELAQAGPDFVKGLCLSLKQSGQRGALELIASRAAKGFVQCAALDCLAPAPPWVLSKLRTRGYQTVRAVAEHAIAHGLDHEAADVIVQVLGDHGPRGRDPQSLSIIRDLDFPASAIVLAETARGSRMMAGAGLFYGVVSQSRQLVCGAANEQKFVALIGMYARAGLSPVDTSVHPPTCHLSFWVDRPTIGNALLSGGSNVLVMPAERPVGERLLMTDVVCRASPAVLRALAQVGFRLRSKDVVEHLYLPRGRFEEHSERRMEALSAAGVWRRPTRGQIAYHLADADRRRDEAIFARVREEARARREAGGQAPEGIGPGSSGTWRMFDP